MNEIKSDICQGGPTAPDVYLVGNEPGQSFGPNYPAPQGRGGGGGDILAYTHVQEMHVATRALQGILRFYTNSQSLDLFGCFGVHMLCGRGDYFSQRERMDDIRLRPKIMSAQSP